MMAPIENVVVDLATALAASVHDPRCGVGVRVESARVEVPVEARWSAQGWSASMPRHRVATGFDAPFTRLRASFAGEEP